MDMDVAMVEVFPCTSRPMVTLLLIRGSVSAQ